MNILFLAHYSELYGANRSLLHLIDGIRKKSGVRVQVIAPAEGDLTIELKRRSVRYNIVPFLYNAHSVTARDCVTNGKAGVLGPMLDIVSKAKPDIIYTNSSIIYYGAWLAKITQTPHVWHLREYGEADYGLVRDLGEDYFRERLGECAFAIAISQAIESHHLTNVPAQRKRVIYNGVARLDQCALLPRTLARGAAPRLALLGVIQPSKGHEQAIEALRIARERVPELTLQIAGSGEPKYLEQLVAQVRACGLSSVVRFNGYIADPLAWLRKEADVLLMPSKSEAFGRVSAEAMTQAIPVIGNATGGTPEVVRDGHNGLLYSGGADALAEKIIQSAGDREAYQVLSCNALEDAKKQFTTERYVGEVYEILEQVAGARRNSTEGKPHNSSQADVPTAPAAHPFLNPTLEPTNCDLYWVRSSIIRALRGALPLFHGSFLDVGCGMMPYKQLIMQSPSQVTRYIGLDIETDIYHGQVDLRWDGKHIPLEDASVDCAMATEVLEHCPDPLSVLKEARRVLKPGGVFFFTVPFIWPLHDTPGDCFRYTVFTLERLLREAGFENVNIRGLGGWNASLAQMIGLWLKRAPLAAETRDSVSKQLWPFYLELIKTDELPADPRAGDTMVTGWSGSAFVPSAAEHGSEVSESSLPVTLVRCHEYQYSETFIQDHVRFLSKRLTLLYGHPFPRYLKGGTSMQSPEFELKLKAAVVVGQEYAPELWSEYTEGMARFLKASGAKVVLAETGWMGALVYQSCELAEIPYVVHFHGVDATGRAILERWGQHYTRFFKSAAALIVVSRAMQDQLRMLGAPDDRIVLAPYGVSVQLPRLADPAANPPQFLAVGRFVEKKAPLNTLQAFALVHRKVPATRLVMVGDGPLLAECRRWAVSHGLGDAVVFTGVQSRAAVSYLMSASRAFVQHSVLATDCDSEGLPLAILEAGAHNLPVVATRHAGIPDAVLDGAHGFLVPEGHVVEMAERIEQLACDSALAAKMGVAFRERVTTAFSRGASIARLQAILKNAAEGRPAKS